MVNYQKSRELAWIASGNDDIRFDDNKQYRVEHLRPRTDGSYFVRVHNKKEETFEDHTIPDKHLNQERYESTIEKANQFDPEISETKRKVSNWEVAKNTVKTIGQGLYLGAHVFPGTALFFPTVARKTHEELDAPELSIVGAAGPILTGFIAARNGYAEEAIYTMIATNAISGIYEIARHHKNKLEEQVE
jgi:hypothetical protein